MAIVSEAPAVSTAGLAATWVLPARDHLAEHDSKLGLQLGITPQPVGGGEGDPLAQLALDLVADLLQPTLTFFTQTHCEPSPLIIDALDRTDGNESWVVVLAAKKLIHGHRAIGAIRHAAAVAIRIAELLFQRAGATVILPRSRRYPITGATTLFRDNKKATADRMWSEHRRIQPRIIREQSGRCHRQACRTGDR